MSRRECWGVFSPSRGWYIGDCTYSFTPRTRSDFSDYSRAFHACSGNEYPRKFWRVKKDKTEWREMSDPPVALQAVLVSDGVDGVVAYHYNDKWYVLWDDDTYSPEPVDKWCELPTR